MILGIGIDIVRDDRIERAINRWGEKFLGRIFTEGERQYCDGHAGSTVRYAARFAVKEAVFKALGCGWDECGGFTSVEVVRSAYGRPEAVLHGRARGFGEDKGVARMHVTITHDAGVAAAVAVLEA